MKFLKFLLIPLIVFLIISCRENVIDFVSEKPNGDLYISSSPTGADIYFNDMRTGKVTPDSLVNIQPGSYLVGVVLLGVGEKTSYADIVSGKKTYIKFNIKE